MHHDISNPDATMMITNDELRSYIQNDLLFSPDTAIEDDQDLLLSGLMDSINVIRLVGHIENTCDLIIPAEDVLLEHFGSISKIHAYLQSREA